MKTKESQLRASRNYRLRNANKVKENCRRYAKEYYKDPIKKEAHKKKMLDYYYKKKKEKDAINKDTPVKKIEDEKKTTELTTMAKEDKEQKDTELTIITEVDKVQEEKETVLATMIAADKAQKERETELATIIESDKTQEEMTQRCYHAWELFRRLKITVVPEIHDEFEINEEEMTLFIEIGKAKKMFMLPNGRVLYRLEGSGHSNGMPNEEKDLVYNDRGKFCCFYERLV